MSSDRNKALALEFLGLLRDNRVDDALAKLAPDATWWVAGEPARLRVAGLKTRAQTERLLHGLKKGFPDGLHLTVTGITAEHDRVAVEVDGTGRWHDGKPYHNHYHFLFVIADSGIVTVREYMDTLHVHDVNQP